MELFQPKSKPVKTATENLKMAAVPGNGKQMRAHLTKRDLETSLKNSVRTLNLGILEGRKLKEEGSRDGASEVILIKTEAFDVILNIGKLCICHPSSFPPLPFPST